MKSDVISRMYFESLAKKYRFSLDTPVKDLSKEVMDVILYGTKGEKLELHYDQPRGKGVLYQPFEGIVNNLERRYQETQSESVRAELEECMSECPCPACQGRRLRRESLAVTVGVMAMLLLLLSELLPSGNTQKTAASTVRTAAVSQYQTQLEQQLEELISQLQGAGRTTVMVTLTTGEETIYAVDTQAGDLQQQETHVLLQEGSALAETTYLPQVCGVAVLCEGGGDVRVAARITELVGALLDVPSNRICVEQRRE